jgi:hypothetical protein
MFDVYCPTHEARVLLGSRSIEALVNTDHGTELHWRCTCGTTGVLRPKVVGRARYAEAA